MNIHGIKSVGTLTQETNAYAWLSGSFTGSFTGSFKGDGSQLTGIVFDTGHLLLTQSFHTYTQSVNLFSESFDNRLDNIESYTSSLKTAIGLSGANVTILGDLTVAGTTTQINSTQVNIGENTIELNYGGTALFSGMYVKDATGASEVSGSLLWDATNDYWIAGKKGTEKKILTDGMGIVSGSTQLGDFETTGRNIVSSSTDTANVDISINSGVISADLKGGVVSGSEQITALGFVSSSITGSLLITASYAGSTLTFTKGDNSTFGLNISAGLAETASLAIAAQDVIVNVKNTTGIQLNRGTVVRIIGSVASSDVALIQTASWENDGSSANTLGFVSESIANDSFGRVITQGIVKGINTDGFVAGQLLYLSSSGQYTNVKPPPPYHEVRLGQVLRTHQTQGSVFASIMNGYELEELHDVDINTGSLLNNNLVAWNSTATQWVNKTVTEVGATTTASFHSYTSSTNIRLDALEVISNSWVRESETGSFYVAAGYDSEAQLLTFINATGSIDYVDMGSLLQRIETGSLLITASASGNTITFYKGDNETSFSINLTGGSAGTISGSSQLTSSFDGRYVLTGSFDTVSASVDGRLDNLESFTSSIDTTIKNKLNTETVLSGSAQITAFGFISSSNSVGLVIPTSVPLPSNPLTGSMAISVSVFPDDPGVVWLYLGPGRETHPSSIGWYVLA